MIFILLLSIANAQDCGKNLTPPFTEYNIAKAIEVLGPRDGRLFGAVMNGYTYEAVAKHYGFTTEWVIEVTRRGADLIWEKRDDK